MMSAGPGLWRFGVPIELLLREEQATTTTAEAVEYDYVTVLLLEGLMKKLQPFPFRYQLNMGVASTKFDEPAIAVTGVTMQFAKYCLRLAHSYYSQKRGSLIAQHKQLEKVVTEKLARLDAPWDKFRPEWVTHATEYVTNPTTEIASHTYKMDYQPDLTEAQTNELKIALKMGQVAGAEPSNSSSESFPAVDMTNDQMTQEIPSDENTQAEEQESNIGATSGPNHVDTRADVVEDTATPDDAECPLVDHWTPPALSDQASQQGKAILSRLAFVLSLEINKHAEIKIADKYNQKMEAISHTFLAKQYSIEQPVNKKGSVWQVRKPPDGRIAVVKLTTDPSAEQLSVLPHVAQTHPSVQCKTSNGDPCDVWIVEMDKGLGTLADLTAKGPIKDQGMRRTLFTHVLTGMSSLLNHACLYTDLKTSNVAIFVEDGRKAKAKIIDFEGMQKFGTVEREGSTKYTNSGGYHTLRWTDPAWYQQQKELFCRHNLVWTLGVVLLELTIGQQQLWQNQQCPVTWSLESIKEWIAEHKLGPAMFGLDLETLDLPLVEKTALQHTLVPLDSRWKMSELVQQWQGLCTGQNSLR
eukprot:TRINITY_DN59734_c0_g1_i1.p1 TRINITY_DN59734_c0_g1~~TRINITY_DN59734_c0_g1_i1.p1  ORF type:complete len:652 (+),score=34.49 TRINITY_DN59734_c0_g1_i1:212-1957(+)